MSEACEMSRACETMLRELLEPTGKDKASFGSKRGDGTMGALFYHWMSWKGKL